MARRTKSAMGLGRRQFLKGAAAGVAAGALSGTSAIASAATGAQQGWDGETEVLVLGTGTAGIAAAIAAAQSDSQVLVLERAPNPGGSSRRSGGVIYLGGGTRVQLSTGFEDSADNMYNYLVAAMGRGADEAKIRAYCDGSVDLFNWLVDLGVPFKDTHVSGKLTNPATDDCLFYSGSETSYPYHLLAEPVPRGHKVQGEQSTGHILMDILQENAVGLGVSFEYETRARRLLVDSGRVVGVEVEKDGRLQSIAASKAVIVATGGFQFDEQLVALHCPQYLKTAAPLGAPEEDGDGLRMGQSVGAEVQNLERGSPWKFMYPPTEMVKSLLVNKQGRRFITEDIYGGNASDATVTTHDGIAFLIYDEAIKHEVGAHADNLEPIAQAESAEDLAQQLDIPAVVLRNTIEFYNAHAEDGQDPVFHKRSQYVQPLLSPPYYALDFSGVTGGMVWITLGGLRTDATSRVLDPYGNQIPGLYAAGRAAGYFGSFYNSGTALGDCAFFGRVAGMTAAQAPARTVRSVPALL